MNYTDILKDVKAGKFLPVYLLHGDEPYFIDKICDAIEEHALQEHERAFNQTVLYGKDTDHLMIVDAARRFPMMAPRQLVLVKEAQDIKDLKTLLPYAKNPSPQTVLVLCYKHKKLNTTSEIVKVIKENGLVFQSKVLYDNEVPDWIIGYLATRKLSIAAQTAALIGEYLGTDLSKIANELDKLSISIPAGATISTQDVEQNIGISRDYNVFELHKALGSRNILQANRIINYFGDNPKNNPLPVVIGSLYGYFSKVYQLAELGQAADKEVMEKLQLRSVYAVRDYRAASKHYPRTKTEQVIRILKEYDLKSKGVDYSSTGKSEVDLLKEMTWRILHA